MPFRITVMITYVKLLARQGAWHTVDASWTVVYCQLHQPQNWANGPQIKNPWMGCSLCSQLIVCPWVSQVPSLCLSSLLYKITRHDPTDWKIMGRLEPSSPPEVPEAPSKMRPVSANASWSSSGTNPSLPRRGWPLVWAESAGDSGQSSGDKTEIKWGNKNLQTPSKAINLSRGWAEKL